MFFSLTGKLPSILVFQRDIPRHISISPSLPELLRLFQLLGEVVHLRVVLEAVVLLARGNRGQQDALAGLGAVSELERRE